MINQDKINYLIDKRKKGTLLIPCERDELMNLLIEDRKVGRNN